MSISMGSVLYLLRCIIIDSIGDIQTVWLHGYSLCNHILQYIPQAGGTVSVIHVFLARLPTQRIPYGKTVNGGRTMVYIRGLMTRAPNLLPTRAVCYILSPQTYSCHTYLRFFTPHAARTTPPHTTPTTAPTTPPPSTDVCWRPLMGRVT